MTPRTWWATVLICAVAVSVAGNVGHALLTAPPSLRVPAAIAAALPPIALLAVTEGLARTAGAGVRRTAYRAGVAGGVAIALLAFVLSFAAMRDLAIALGQPSAVAAGWPLLADATIAVSSVLLLAMKPMHGGDALPAVPADGAVRLHHPDAPADAALTQLRHGDVSAASSTLTSPDAAVHEPLHLVAPPAVEASEADDAADTAADAVKHQAAELVQRGVTRLEVDVVADVLHRHHGGESQRGIGRTLGVDPRTVAGIVAAARDAVEVKVG